jgi:hypothetical protein
MQEARRAYERIFEGSRPGPVRIEPRTSLLTILIIRSAQTSLRSLLPPPARARNQLGRQLQFIQRAGTSRDIPGRRMGDAEHVDLVHVELRKPSAAPLRVRARHSGWVRARVHHQGRRAVRVRVVEALANAPLPRHTPGLPRGGAARACRARARCERAARAFRGPRGRATRLEDRAEDQWGRERRGGRGQHACVIVFSCCLFACWSGLSLLLACSFILVLR